MRIFLKFAFCVLTALNGICQTDTSFHFLAKPDKILQKHEGGYIYITSDTSSQVFNWIVPNPDDELIKSIYTDYIDHIKTQFGCKAKAFAIGNFPRKWNEVYSYQKNYVLYAPSDWMANSGFYISDSVIYITSSDPSDIYLIRDFYSTGVKRGNFVVVNYNGEFLNIEIKVVDATVGIYRWIIKNKGEVVRNILMQNSDFSKKLKMIVCDCGDTKCLMEFDFKE